MRSFDPHSRGARRLGRAYLRSLEQWEMRLVFGYLDLPETGAIESGQQFVIDPGLGRELLAAGQAELLRRVYPRQ